jgi:enoyl-CoA hydratase/carnithine racemase
MTVKVESHENVTVLRLDNGVTNAIGPLMLDALCAAIDAIDDRTGAIVLAGNPKFFSMGFDLPHLLTLNRARMSDFFFRFNDVVCTLFTLPLPTVCAMAGHAVAGGNILALTCDYRLGVAGKKIGLNEIQLGVPVPYLAGLMLGQLAGDRVAKKMLYEGYFLETDEARQVGLIDAVYPLESVEAQAVAKATELAALSPAAFAAMKAVRVETLQQQYKSNGWQKNEQFLDCWFSKQAQALLNEASRKFR